MHTAQDRKQTGALKCCYSKSSERDGFQPRRRGDIMEEVASMCLSTGMERSISSGRSFYFLESISFAAPKK